MLREKERKKRIKEQVCKVKQLQTIKTYALKINCKRTSILERQTTEYMQKENKKENSEEQQKTNEEVEVYNKNNCD